jgi:protoporphyrinogen oxidase
MWEACRDKIVAGGGEVMTEMDVTAVRHDGSRIQSLSARDASGKEHTFKAKHYVSSAALKDLLAYLDPGPPARLLEAAKSLRYRDFIVVHLIIDRADMFPDNWIYIHSPKVRVGRIQNSKNWSADLVPDQSTTSLGLEYFCFEGDDLWRKTDAELVENAASELRAIGLMRASDKVVDGCVVKLVKTYPMYVGDTFREDLEIVRDYLLGFENLHCCGRNGQHRYNNQDHSMYTASLAVENILGANHDIWNVNVERVYHEEVEEKER